jgi:hypothetical protein
MKIRGNTDSHLVRSDLAFLKSRTIASSHQEDAGRTMEERLEEARLRASLGSPSK